SPYTTTAAGFKSWLEGPPTDADLKTLTQDLYDSGVFQPTGTAGKAKNGKDVEISGLDYGYYLVVGEGEPEQGGSKAIVRYSLVTVSEKDVLMKLKADVPWVEKFVSDENLGQDSGDWGKETDVFRGDTVYFMIRSNVPDMTGYDDYTFTVHDTMNAAFAFNSSSVDIRLVDRDGVEDDVPLGVFSDYTVSSNYIYANGGSGQISGTYVNITFKNFLKYRHYADWEVVITYNAKFGATGAYAPAPNPNEVHIEYSNDPYTGGTGNTNEDIVNVYTFNLQIYKIDGTSKVLLDGAVFELRTKAGDPESAVKVTLMHKGSGGLPNIYYVDDKSTETEIEVTGNGGSSELPGQPAFGAASYDGAHISGLKQGTYYLYEIKAPDGYNKMEHEEPVVISHKIVNGVSDFHDQVVYIENSAGAKLPDTGGAGTSALYISGILLAIGIAVFLISRRKRNLLDE
ncbi:MAG: SpaH/EbpB family LPXTG-anchored major pilin, partial [Clostridiales bacterium]|nr:SpaH/EbpB family LPXTG-anchored major pilin [Clostridiales bacterium]